VGFGYNYDGMGNKTAQRKLHAPNDSELYSYDSAYRLLSLQRGLLNAAGTMIVGPADHAPRQTSWNLDGAGNLHQVNGVGRPLSPTNALLAVGSTAHSFDRNGNETGDGTYQFSWDFENRLRAVNTVPADRLGSLIATYAYTADGERDRQVVT